MIHIGTLNIKEIIEKNALEQLFHIDFKNEDWIWINRDIFLDIVYNGLDYSTINEDELKVEIENVSDQSFIELLSDKFKEIGWISVEQQLFERLVADFICTKDIQTYIFTNKRFYNRRIIQKTKEFNWIFKAMALDAYQHLAIEDKTLIEVFEEYFKDNGMIIEDILLEGKYEFNVAYWEFDAKTNLLEFYKLGKNYRQWTEGHSNFMFNELSKKH